MVELDPNQLYTSELIVFQSRVDVVQLSPIFYGQDEMGNKYVTDGNHRSVKALLGGEKLPGERISMRKGDISKDPNFRKISELRIQ